MEKQLSELFNLMCDVVDRWSGFSGKEKMNIAGTQSINDWYILIDQFSTLVSEMEDIEDLSGTEVPEKPVGPG